MRVVCISDTHNLHNDAEIPHGDLLIHAGDITAIGEMDVLIDFNQWLGKLPHTYKIVVAGNHDFCFEKQPAKAQAVLTNAIYLNNSGCEIEGLKIWGSPISPISPKFGGDWAFNVERGPEIRRYWEQIPANIDILITHCPPYGILDRNEIGNNEGCKDLMDLIENHIRPRVHIFGHIHEAHGQLQVGVTNYVNASIVGLKSWIADYKLTRQLRIIAISIFQEIKQVRKKIFGVVSKEKLHNRILSGLHWKVKNKAIVIEI